MGAPVTATQAPADAGDGVPINLPAEARAAIIELQTASQAAANRAMAQLRQIDADTLKGVNIEGLIDYWTRPHFERHTDADARGITQAILEDRYAGLLTNPADPLESSKLSVTLDKTLANLIAGVARRDPYQGKEEQPLARILGDLETMIRTVVVARVHETGLASE